MRLSEAIRLGAMLRPTQAFYVMFDAALNATCALGAAAEAVGILDTTVCNGYTGKAPREWRAVVRRGGMCPELAHGQACGWHFERLDDAIIHLNNDHRWTREAIADWVATLERADERIAPPASAAAVDPVEEVVAG